MNKYDKKIIDDGLTRLCDIDFTNIRYLVLLESYEVTLIKSRRELKQLISSNEGEIKTIYQLSDRTDRFIDYEDYNKYMVGVNVYEENEFYCEYIDKQFTIYVLAESIKEACDKATQKVIEMSGSITARFEPVWIKQYDFKNDKWQDREVEVYE